MSFIGNLVWVVFGGLLLSLCYLFLGIIFCCTIVGIPVGLQLFKLAQLSLFPFGHEIVARKGNMGLGYLLLNIVWILCGGLQMALAHVVMGLFFCVTIVGIPFGMQHFKLGALALLPFGSEIR